MSDVSQADRWRHGAAVDRVLSTHLVDGMPNGPYGNWWEPCPERIPIAADALFETIEAYVEGGVFDTDGPCLRHLMDWWAVRLGYRGGFASWEGYELLELTGMTADQFVRFWWLLHHDQGYPVEQEPITRRLNALRRFAHTLVLEVMFPGGRDNGNYGCVPEQAVELGLYPTNLYELEFENNHRGFPHWIR